MPKKQSGNAFVVVIVGIMIIVWALLGLTSCCAEIFDPMNCETIYPVFKGRDYYLCVQARELEKHR